MTSQFIPPRYELPIANPETGRVNLEWYKFIVPLAKLSVPSTRAINTTAPLSGGSTLAADLTLALVANGVTNAYLAQMATHTIKGNATGGTANAADLTGTQVTALLDAFTSVLKGLVPASGGGTANALLADGSWGAAVSGSWSAGTFLKSGTPVLVAALPAAATAGAGARHMVTDALVPVFGNAVAGTGAVVVPVYSDGTIWRVG